MKTFLTEEQRDLLRKKLSAMYNRSNPCCADFLEKIENMINECTIKDFPELYMRPHHNYDMEPIEIYQSDCSNGSTNCIVLFSEVEHIHLSKKEFLEFAEGVNRIAEWIKENE